MTEARKTYKVIQWATGNVGSRALRAVIEHPALELVGLYVTSDAKNGKDAGALCGLDREVGIKATTSIDEIMALDADCVIYMPAYTNIDQVCAILASGKNVATPRGEFLHPSAMPAGYREKVEAACAAGGTSIHSSGSSPGFITEKLPIPLLAQQRRLDCLTIDEFADMSSRDSPDMIFNMMGYGREPRDFNDQMLNHVKMDFQGSLIMLAEAMNLPIDEISAVGEMGAATKDIVIAAGTIKQGTVAALRMTVSAMRGGKPILKFRSNWYCGTDIDKDWALRDSGWNVLVEGDAPIEMVISFPVKPEDYAAFTPGLTAHPVVNAVPVVCDAAPGIRTTVELPQIIATF